MMRHLVALFLVLNITIICSPKHGRFFDKKDAKKLRAHGPSRRTVLEEPKDLLQRGHPGKPDPTDDVVNGGPPEFERKTDLQNSEESRLPSGEIERRREFLELQDERRTGPHGPPGPPGPNDGAMKRDSVGHPSRMDKRLPENLGTGKLQRKVNLPHFINASVQKPRKDCV